jgi:uncharacterized damage-inducible protein DinB
MIKPDYVRTMAAYNRWQNRSLYREADALTDAERKEPRGAFFGSIHGTLNHLLWGDQMWMSRFAGTPAPRGKRPAESTAEHESWAELKAARESFDEVIIDWAGKLDDAWLQGDLAWFSTAAGRDMAQPKALLVTHFFNHQTHHRGQVHCLLTQYKRKPDDTDLPFQPA